MIWWVRSPPSQCLTCSLLEINVPESESLSMSKWIFWFTNDPWVSLSGVSDSPAALMSQPTRSWNTRRYKISVYREETAAQPSMAGPTMQCRASWPGPDLALHYPVAHCKTSSRNWWAPEKTSYFPIFCFSPVIILFSSSKWDWKHMLWIREWEFRGNGSGRSKKKH